MLWYSLTTTLNPDTIAQLFNTFFKPDTPIDRWAIADIVNEIETRYDANGHSFGQDFRLERPAAYGSCPCDFHLEDFPGVCVDVKRTRRSRQNERYLSIAQSLWDQPANELVRCPRGNGGEKRAVRLHTMQKMETQPLPWYDIRNLYMFCVRLARFVARFVNNTVLPSSRRYLPTFLLVCYHVVLLVCPGRWYADDPPQLWPIEKWIREWTSHIQGIVCAAFHLLPRLIYDLYAKAVGSRPKPWAAILIDALCGLFGLIVFMHAAGWALYQGLKLWFHGLFAILWLTWIISVSVAQLEQTMTMPFNTTAALN